MRLGSLLTGAVLGGALVYGALLYHVLRTQDGVELVPKSTATFAETYVDIRTFGVSDWAAHKSLASDIVKAKKEHLFGNAAAHTLQEGLDSVMGQFRENAPSGLAR